MDEAEISLPPELIEILHNVQRVAALTGAGISAESGVPTFRQAQSGLWERYRPEDLATPEAFMNDPQLVWEWYRWRRELVINANPNAGHYALAEMERHYPGFSLITQNVDNLHQRAGSQVVIELHGNIQRTRCFNEGALIKDWDEVNGSLPTCPYCGGLLRPDVVWFGEALPVETLEAAWEAARECEVFFSIGTSSLVEPAASLPFLALDAGAMVIEINTQDTPLTQHATLALHGLSGSILSALVKALWPDVQLPGITP